jgi:predicted DNA-binding transcriptional regulator AlpA
MKTETLDVIRTILAADETVPKDKIDIVLRNFRQMKTHRHLIGARQAMEILGVSRPTLRAYVKQGFISQIGFSSRKIRFDEDEIRRFADTGAPSTTSCPKSSSTGATDAPKAIQTRETDFEF